MTVSDNNNNSLVPKMTRIEFINELKKRLSFLPETERNKSILYYNEIIDDRVENGMDEITAIACLESPAIIAERIMSESGLFEGEPSPLSINPNPPPITKSKAYSQNENKSYSQSYNRSTSYTEMKKSKMSTGKLLFLILGFPLWFPLLITGATLLFAAVIIVVSLMFAAYATVWSLVFASFCVSAALALGCVGLVILSPFMMFRNGIVPSVFSAGVGLISGAGAIAMWILSVNFAKAMTKFTAFTFGWITSMVRMVKTFRLFGLFEKR